MWNKRYERKWILWYCEGCYVTIKIYIYGINSYYQGAFANIWFMWEAHENGKFNVQTAYTGWLDDCGNYPFRQELISSIVSHAWYFNGWIVVNSITFTFSYYSA